MYHVLSVLKIFIYIEIYTLTTVKSAKMTIFLYFDAKFRVVCENMRHFFFLNSEFLFPNRPVLVRSYPHDTEMCN